MSSETRRSRWLRGIVVVSGAAVLATGSVVAQQPAAPVRAGDPTFVVDGQIALNALMSLADAQIRRTADVLSLLARMDAVRSADWSRIREPLADAARAMPAAVHWFALPDGSYWTVETGRAGSLADRAYFRTVLGGRVVLGELVVSRSTNRSTAIVAVPVRDGVGGVVGVLGASIHLDSLSAALRRDLALEPDHLFFTLNSEPVVGLHSDPHIIFLHPMQEDDPNLQRAMRELLSREAGALRYEFRGVRRTVLYRRSPLTGWWYAFGLVTR